MATEDAPGGGWHPDPDDDVDIFVFAAEDESLTPVADEPRPVPTPPQHDGGDDWNDTSWLQDLDGATGLAAPGDTLPDGAPPAAPTGSTSPPSSPTAPDGDAVESQLDEAAQVLADASVARRVAGTADGTVDADVGELLRELSLLSFDD